MRARFENAPRKTERGAAQKRSLRLRPAPPRQFGGSIGRPLGRLVAEERERGTFGGLARESARGEEVPR